MGNSSSVWETVLVDTDWSTTFRWRDAGVPDSVDTVERNVLTAVFDMIGSTLGVHFDYQKAMELHEQGKFKLPQSLRDVMSDKRHRRLIT